VNDTLAIACLCGYEKETEREKEEKDGEAMMLEVEFYS